MSHLFIGIEVLSMTAPQKATLVAALRALGPQADPQPARLNHSRTRLDGNAAMFEAAFGDNEVTIDAVKQYLANAFGVDPATITHVVAQTAYGPLVTLARAGVDRLRLIQFGGVSPIWAESGEACRAYLIANAAAWEAA